jgi:hypothetical protein
MISRRTIVCIALGVAMLATATSFAFTYFTAWAAGALAGTLTWADKNHCLADDESWVIYDLNQYQKWWREAFNAGFLASSEKLTAAKTTVGLSKSCELYIDPLKEDISRGSIQVGLWRFGVQPPSPFLLALLKKGIITPAQFAEYAKGDIEERQRPEQEQQEFRERWERARREVEATQQKLALLAKGIITPAQFAESAKKDIEERQRPEQAQQESIEATQQKAKYVAHIDRANGFSVAYGSSWKQVQPNEEVTKLVVNAPDGSRCWVTVVPNPLSTDEDAPRIVQGLINNKAGLQAALSKVLGEVHVAEVRPVIMSGNRDAALISYSFKHSALDKKIAVAVLEAHILVQAFTYKVGCSTLDSALNGDSETGAGSFMRSFLFIPRSAQ